MPTAVTRCNFSSTIMWHAIEISTNQFRVTFLCRSLKYLFTCLFFTGTNSSPDEDRLLQHLFHPDHQPHNLLTTPIANKNKTINVSVEIDILNFIALVSYTLCAHDVFSFVDDLHYISHPQIGRVFTGRVRQPVIIIIVYYAEAAVLIQ